MNEDILYQQYLSNNTESPISIEEFTSLKSIMSSEDYRDWETDRKSTRLNSSHITRSRMPSSA